MNPFEFVIAIVAIVTIGSIIRAKHLAGDGRLRGMRRSRHLRAGEEPDEDDQGMIEAPDTRALRDEVKQLKERIKVLERIAVDKENALAREIDSLRD